MRGAKVIFLIVCAFILAGCATSPKMQAQYAQGQRCFKVLHMPAEYRLNPRGRLLHRSGATVHEIKEGQTTLVDFVRKPEIYLESRKLLHADYYSILPSSCASATDLVSLMGPTSTSTFDLAQMTKSDVDKLYKQAGRGRPIR